MRPRTLGSPVREAAGRSARVLAGRFQDGLEGQPGPSLTTCQLQQGPDQSGFDLLIQGTSLGHQGRCPPLDAAWLQPDAVGYDLNYGAAARPFLEWCEGAGIIARDGIGMLVEQAAEAFELFTGAQPRTEPVHAWLATRAEAEDGC